MLPLGVEELDALYSPLTDILVENLLRDLIQSFWLLQNALSREVIELIE